MVVYCRGACAAIVLCLPCRYRCVGAEGLGTIVEVNWRKQFKGRDCEIEAVRNFISDGLKPSGASVMCVYGPSGNGKSWLARQVRHMLSTATPPVTYAFLDLDHQGAIEAHDLLLQIRNGLAGSGDNLRFDAFDIGLLSYWREAFRNRGQPLPALTNSLVVPKSGGTVADVGALLGAGGFVNLGRRLLGEAAYQATLAAYPDLGSLVEKAAAGTLTAYDLRQSLPRLLAWDIAAWRHSMPRRPVAVIIDTLDGGREGGGAESQVPPSALDTVLQGLSPLLPYAALFLFSREPVTWTVPQGVVLEQRLLEGLDRSAADEALATAHPLGCGAIEDSAVRNAMLDIATVDKSTREVYPLVFDLLRERHRQIAEQRPPEPADFEGIEGDTREGRIAEVLEHVVRNYDAGLKALLERLAVARRFDAALVEALVEAFGIEFPKRRYRDLDKLSLFRSDGAGLVLHARIADCLAARLDNDDWLATNRLLHKLFMGVVAHATESGNARAAVAALGRAAMHVAADGEADLTQWWADTSDHAKSRFGEAALASLAEEMNAELQHRPSDPRARAMGFTILGDVHEAMGDHERALRHQRQSLELRIALVATDPAHSTWQRDLWNSYVKIGDLLSSLGKHDNALKKYQRASAAIFDFITNDYPTNVAVKCDVSMILNRIGIFFLENDDADRATTAFQQSLDIAIELTEESESVPFLYLESDGWLNMANVSLKNKNADTALAMCAMAYRAAELVERKQPGNAVTQDRLGTILTTTGDAHRAKGNLQCARNAYNVALAVRHSLAAQDRDNAEWQRGLLVSNVKLAEVADAEHQASDAAAHLRTALDIADQLAQGGRLAPVDAWMHDDLRRRLEALNQG